MMAAAIRPELTATPSTAASRAPARHTVVVRLHDRPGALYRAIGLIRRRAYNVSSLVVGHSERPGTSRMVLVVEACNVRQVMQQLGRLIDVLSVEEVETEPSHVDSFVEQVLRFESGLGARDSGLVNSQSTRVPSPESRVPNRQNPTSEETSR